MIPRYYVVAERDHEIQNPTSEEKLRLLGERVRLGPGRACSTSRPVAVGRPPARPRVRVHDRGHRDRARSSTPPPSSAPAAPGSRPVSFRLETRPTWCSRPAAYDVAMCLGASFVWGGLAGTLDALEPVVRPGGHVVVGEPFGALPLPGRLRGARRAVHVARRDGRDHRDGRLRVVTVIDSSRGRLGPVRDAPLASVEEWLAEHAGRPGRRRDSRRHERWKRTYLRHGREHLGWAIFVG